MMTMKEVLNHKPYFNEWIEDVKRLYTSEKKAIELVNEVEINCSTLKEAFEFIDNEIENEWNIEGAVLLIEDLEDFLMLDL